MHLLCSHRVIQSFNFKIFFVFFFEESRTFICSYATFIFVFVCLNHINSFLPILFEKLFFSLSTSESMIENLFI